MKRPLPPTALSSDTSFLFPVQLSFGEHPLNFFPLPQAYRGELIVSRDS